MPKEVTPEEVVEEQVEAAGAAAGEAAAAQGATQEEVDAKVEAARKQEKDKLYPVIEELRNSHKEIAETLKKEREEKDAEKQAALDAAEAARREGLTASEKTQEAIRNLEEKLRVEREAREKFEHEAKEAARKADLEKYRQNALRVAGNEIIPELVQGNSEAEIDKSVTFAKARYEELANKFKVEAGDRVRKGMPKSTNPDTRAQEELELDEALTDVDTDKYMKDPAYRARIQNELEQAYARQAGRG